MLHPEHEPPTTKLKTSYLEPRFRIFSERAWVFINERFTHFYLRHVGLGKRGLT